VRIVVFSSQIWNRTGGELNARDWALGLRSRGHKVVAYTPVPGRLAEEIRAAGVPFVDDPAAMRDEPDVMYGSGIHDVAALAARFPDVPIVQVSQQFDGWASFPSPLPQVVLHVCVDEINADSLANEFGVARERIRILHNAIDLALLKPRLRPLPVQPQRALAFVKRSAPYMRELQEACSLRGIELECVGPGAGNAIHDVFSAVAESDLVVGSARTALEGAAGGAAVLVADHRGLGGLLTSHDHARFCADNFGRELLTRPLDAASIGAEIDRYDAADAACVTRIVRETASQERQLERLESILLEATAAFRRDPAPPEARHRALSSYLARHLPRHGEPSPRHPHQAACAADPRFVNLDSQVSILSERVSGLELERALASGSASPVPSPAAAPKTRCNLLARSEELDAALSPNAFATFERIGALSAGASTYLARASEGCSEHYVQHTFAPKPGALTFSLGVREVSAPRLRLQLLTVGANGVVGDFDFRREQLSVSCIGLASGGNGGCRVLRDGWYTLWITALPPPGDPLMRCVIQLADRQERFTFTPHGEAILARGLQVELGPRPTPYQATPNAPRSRLGRLARKIAGLTRR